MRSDRLGLFIIRAWLEGASPLPLRIEIRLTDDVSSGFQGHLALSDVNEACDALRAWLTKILVDQELDGEPPLSS